MIKARAWFTLLLVSVGTVAATASCGSDEATGGGGGGAAGGGLIGASGRAGATGRAGSGGDTATGTATALIGAGCGTDSDCGDGLLCLTADGGKLGGSSPGNGLCTAPCATNAACAALQAGSACINFGTSIAPALYCLQSCAEGEPDDISTKCQGRLDMACSALSDGSTFCLPECRADADCGTGLYCQPKTGLCGKTKPSGLPVGVACDPSATTDPCEGFCITTSAMGVTPVTGTCMETCSGGVPCMYSNDASPVPGGLCSGPSLDLGICRPNCACTSDCTFPGYVCRAWSSNATEQEYKTALGADGMCYPNVIDSVELDCGEGGAGGVSGMTPGIAGAPALP